MGVNHHSPNGMLLESLTWREQDILSLLAEHHSDREIARELVLSLNTIKWYNKQIYSKLGVESRRQAVAKAQEYRLLDGSAEARTGEGLASKNALPRPLTSFVGREREIAAARQLLQEARLLTLTGPAGTGKTRLALRAAADALDEFGDGVFFIDLAPISQPELVGDTIAEALGVVTDAGQPITNALAKYLTNKKLLLLVDNFEHLLEAAPLVGDLLAAAPDLSVLVTSREALGLYGEQEYPVPPLRLPDLSRPDSPLALSNFEAVALFTQRARAVNPGFVLSEETAPAVAEICVRLDGLPLAIELAAARVKVFSPQALLGQMDQRFTALGDGPRNRPERQQTLRGAIDWSYALLDEIEKTLFARLSIFQGGRTIEAVEAVCCHDLSLDVLDGLASLLNKNLLRQEEGPEGEPRFMMLETIHAYGYERLQDSGEEEDMRRRHAEYFTALAEQEFPNTRGGPNQMRCMRRLNADYNNLRAVLEWSLGGADTSLGLRLVGALSWFWFRWYQLADGQRWTGRVVEAIENGAAAPQVRAAALLAAGLLAIYQEDHLTGQKHQREAAAIYRELGDRHNLGWALIELSTQSIGYPDEYGEAVATCNEGLALLREEEDKVAIAHALNVLGELARLYEDYSNAKEFYKECLSIAREIGDTLREAKQLVNLGFIAHHQGDEERAQTRFQEFLALALKMDFKPSMAYSLAALAGPAIAMGQPERGARLVGAGFAQFEQLGVTPQPADLPEFERYRDNARGQLSPAAFKAAWAAGQAMSLEEAVAYALEEPRTDG